MCVWVPFRRRASYHSIPLFAEIDEEEDLLEEETSQKEETATNPLELPYGG